MSTRLLNALALAGIAVATLVILYITLTPEPPRWRSIVPSAITAPEVVPTPSGWTDGGEEALGHAALFFALGVSASLWYATSGAARRRPQRTLVATMLLLWLLGGITEALQALTPERQPQLSDLAFDVLGAFVGFLGGGLLWRLLLTRRPRR
ncbi:MAG: VanZ family protein [Dehalococcoidia bacterium]